VAILVGLGKKDDMGPFLVGDFIFVYFVGAIFKSLVVGLFALDVANAIKDALFMVD
jgi:hypothetical protein